MNEAEAGLALFLNVIMPLIFYVGSQWAVLKISNLREKKIHYRFMLIDLTVINATVFITSMREIMSHTERFVPFTVYGVFMAFMIFPSIVALLGKISEPQTIIGFTVGSIFMIIGFGSLIYAFSLFFIIPIIPVLFFSIGLLFWFLVLVLKKKLPGL